MLLLHKFIDTSSLAACRNLFVYSLHCFDIDTLCSGSLLPYVHRHEQCCICKLTYVCYALHAGGIRWGRLGTADHMFSLPITPTAHLNQRGFGPPGHSSRLSHVSRADSYAARHTFAEAQSSLSRNTSVLPLPPSSSRTSGRHSTPASPPSSKATLRSSTSKAASLAATGGARTTFRLAEPAGYLPEASGKLNVSLDVDAHSPASNASMAAPSRDDSFSSSSSQESVSTSSVSQQPSTQILGGTR